MTTPAGLAEQAQEFGQDMTALLLATLPGIPVPPIEILQAGDRVIIRSPGPELLPLYAGRQRIAGYEGQRGLSDGYDGPVPGGRGVNLRPVRRGRPGPLL